MRYYTYGVGAALVRELELAGAVRTILHDGADIIHLHLTSGESLMIHLIDSHIPLYEIKNTLTANTAAGHCTLFILWCDMLLPDAGQRVALQDWQHGLMALYGDQIYAYKVYMQRLSIFPVYFDRLPFSTQRVVRYGEPVHLGTIGGGSVHTRLDGLNGTWYTAAFDRDRHARRATLAVSEELLAHYRLLQLDPGADIDTVKKTYRELARRYHPDVNVSAEATARMQAINRAYAAILRQWDDGRRSSA
jgi:hypothetical protein